MKAPAPTLATAAIAAPACCSPASNGPPAARREAEHDLHQAIARATRLGLAQRDIATAAQIAHGTVRAILTRANGDTATAPAEPDGTPPPSHAIDGPLPS
jgi:hypothetical protein